MMKRIVILMLLVANGAFCNGQVRNSGFEISRDTAADLPDGWGFRCTATFAGTFGSYGYPDLLAAFAQSRISYRHRIDFERINQFSVFVSRGKIFFAGAFSLAASLRTR